MKHILPILTAALALTAMTASAAFNYKEFEYHGYDSVSYIKTDGTEVNSVNNIWYMPDVVSQVVHFDGYDVIRTRYNSDKSVSPYQDSFYKIRITGESVKLYLTDYIDNIGGAQQEDSLKDKNISSYGYNYVNSSKTGAERVLANPETFQYEKSPQNNNPDPKEHMITRNGYYLGTFEQGDEIEVFLKDGNGGYASSNNPLYVGAFGDGSSNTDSLAEYQNGNSTEAARKAMPLAALDTGNGHRVFFGIYGMAGESGTVGSPLPGGLQIALIAGLFGLGFYFVRRRKATVA